MIGELIEDLFHTDHRVWRTLRPLLFEPGRLTIDYLRGKRVTYTPPFRLYIVLSLIFFLTNSLSPAHVKVAAPDELAGGIALTPDATSKTFDIDPSAQEKLDEFLEHIDESKRAETRERIEKSLHKVEPSEQEDIVVAMSNPCSSAALGAVLPDKLTGRDILLDVCRKATKDNGKEFSQALGERVPQMLFFFLPLIALFAKVLYLGSHRYYAEHVLFFVHFHAFVFLLLAINNLLGWTLGWIPGTSFVTGLLTTAVVIYSPVYLYKAMRRVYGQGRFVTVLKFCFLLGGYVANMFLVFAIVAAVTAMTLK